MLQISADQFRLYRAGGGELFSEFMDRLLLTHAIGGGLKEDTVRTNRGRVNLRDGGVDAEVGGPIPEDRSGLFSTPTAWQHKGTSFRNVRVNTLLDGAYVQDCVRRGYGFRLAVADSLTPELLTQWEEDLDEHAREISADAPPCKVVTAERLTELTNRYPSLILRHFRPDLLSEIQHLESWRQSTAFPLRRFIPIPEWEGVEQAIRTHVDFREDPHSAVLQVRADSGIGKTRLTFETLDKIPGSHGLVIYSTGDVSRIATILANESHTRAILVADESTIESQVNLRQKLDGHRDRIRVITIDNLPSPVAGVRPDFKLEKMPSEKLEEILESNFPEVPRDRRRAYARLADGYPRFAAYLARHDDRILQSDDLGSVLPSIREVLRKCLPDHDEHDALALLSLFTKLGFRADLADELKQATRLVGMEYPPIRDALQRLHDGAGFAATAGRYYYATPEIVAQAAHEVGWRKWVSDDPQVFLEAIPEQLLESFLRRSATVPSEEVRRACGDYFRGWVNALAPSDLSNGPTVEQLSILTETDPEAYFPRVRQLIFEASHEELQQSDGTTLPSGWLPRRALVWLAEQFGLFPEFFPDSEDILFHLALAESEPNIGNNATAIWEQLFRIVLSGTPVSFENRLEILKSRLGSDVPEARMLVLDALDHALDRQRTRTLPPPVIAGRIPPSEWIPKTRGEEHRCFVAIVHLLVELTESEVGDLADRARAILGNQTRQLLGRGLLDSLACALTPAHTADATMALVLDGVESFFHYDSENLGTVEAQRYLDDVRNWRDKLVGSSFHLLLVSRIGTNPWSARRRHDNSWQGDLQELASHLLKVPEAWSRERDWLYGDEAQGAGELGKALGTLDASESLSEEVLRTALGARNRALARGYLRSLLNRLPTGAQSVRLWLDEHEDEHPEAVVDLAQMGGDDLRALDRTLASVRAGRVPSHWAHWQNLARGGYKLGAGTLSDVLEALISAHGKGDESAARIAMDSLALSLNSLDADGVEPYQDPAVRSAAWRVLELEQAGEAEPYSWSEALEKLAPFDPAKASRLAMHGAMQAGPPSLEAESLTHVLAKNYPTAFLPALEEIMFDKDQGWKFFVSNFRALIASLPVALVRDLVKRRGVDAAQKLARHLPEPHISAGEPVVPPLTSWILEEFEDDDRVFGEFSAGLFGVELAHGNVAAVFESKAEIAARFRNHRLKRIREWAEGQVRAARDQARTERQREEEFWLE